MYTVGEHQKIIIYDGVSSFMPTPVDGCLALRVRPPSGNANLPPTWYNKHMSRNNRPPMSRTPQIDANEAKQARIEGHRERDIDADVADYLANNTEDHGTIDGIPNPFEATLGIYRWTIPTERDDRPWFLDQQSEGIEEARETVLARDDLTKLERHYVNTSAPDKVLPTVAVSLPHSDALRELDGRRELDARITKSHEVFTTLGVDPDNVPEFVDRVNAQAAETVQAAVVDMETRAMTLAGLLNSAIESLGDVVKATGYAVPEPEPPTEPDYAPLVVTSPPGMTRAQFRREYPRLENASVTTKNASEALTDIDREGLRMFYAYHETVSKTVAMSKHETASWEALRDLVTARIGA